MTSLLLLQATWVENYTKITIELQNFKLKGGRPAPYFDPTRILNVNLFLVACKSDITFNLSRHRLRHECICMDFFQFQFLFFQSKILVLHRGLKPIEMILFVK